jgi:O-antigen biosynthesis protein
MLEFTGERFIPGEGDPLIHYEHAHRYVFAMQFAEGRTVLDVASGEGYGACWLSTRAKQVVGVDNATDTVNHATARYGGSGNVRFVLGDAMYLPVASGSIDLVVSFETIEHLDDAEAFLAEITRVLSPSGMVLLSTPNKKTYSDETGFNNEFHTTEFYLDEFERMLAARFPSCVLLGQRVVAASAMWGLSGLAGERQRGVFGEPVDGPAVESPMREIVEPLYAVALCSRDEIDHRLGDMLPSLFVEQAESLMKEYQGRWAEIGRPDPEHVARVEAEVQDLRAALARQEAEVAQRDGALRRAAEELGALNERAEAHENAARVANEELDLMRETVTWRLHTRLERMRIASWIAPRSSRSRRRDSSDKSG